MTSSTRPVTIDATAYSVLICCTRRGCPWRAQVHARRTAWRLFADHAFRVHADEKARQYALRMARGEADPTCPG